MKTTKQNYYFKFEVQDHMSHEHKTFKQAVATAKRLKQDVVYLVIYLRKNIFREPYNEITINDFNLSSTDIDALKIELYNKTKKYF